MRPRTIASVRDIARAHRVALVVTAIAISTLAWLHPAGPGNSSPTDLAMVPAIGAVALWIYLSAERIRTPYGISMGLIVVAGCVSGILGPYLRGALVTVGYPEAPLIAVIQDIYLFVWCLAIVNLARTADALRVLLAAWVYASAFWAALLVIGVFIGVRALSGIEDNNGVRADGQFGDPNMASGFFAMSLFVLWSSAVPRRWWLRAAIAVAETNPRLKVAAQYHLLPHLAGRPFIYELDHAADADVVALQLNGGTWPDGRADPSWSSACGTPARGSSRRASRPISSSRRTTCRRRRLRLWSCRWAGCARCGPRPCSAGACRRLPRPHRCLGSGRPRHAGR